MQVLMSAAAKARTADHLAKIAPNLDVVTVEKVDQSGVFKRGETMLEPGDVDPEVFWFSLDSYGAGLMGDMFGAMMKGSRGRWVQGFSAGLDSPVFGRIMDKGLRLTKSSGQASAIAEYVLAHAISLLHPIAEQAAAQAEHAWKRIAFNEIARSRWLLIGYGSIGQEIAKRVKAFGAEVTVVRRTPRQDVLVDRTGTQADLPQLLPDADVVVLACPLTAETRDMVGEAVFQAMKAGSILINIGRGELVDEEALKRALDRDAPRIAVLDVFRTEPLPADAWFWDHPKVRVTAHCSNVGDGVQARGDRQFLENLRRYVAGEPLTNEAQRWEAG